MSASRLSTGDADARLSTAPGEPLMAATDLVKSFGAVRALQGATLTVPRGQVTALVGDNGAGKSTMIRCLTGVQSPDDGEIRFDGQPVRFHSPEEARARGIETVYQDLALVEDLPVWQNMFLNRELKRGPLLNRRAMIARASETVASLDVTLPSVRSTVRRLSGGQRQAVSIARAIAWGSALVIMDEPTAALGVQETAAVERLIVRLREQGMTMLVISHDIAQVIRIADRVAVMRQGRVVGTRPVHEVTGEDIVAMITGVAAGHAPGEPGAAMPNGTSSTDGQDGLEPEA